VPEATTCAARCAAESWVCTDTRNVPSVVPDRAARCDQPNRPGAGPHLLSSGRQRLDRKSLRMKNYLAFLAAAFLGAMLFAASSASATTLFAGGEDSDFTLTGLPGSQQPTFFRQRLCARGAGDKQEWLLWWNNYS
jgi:hypothetical protein